MYIDRSLRGDSMRYNFIDELNFKFFLCLRRNKTSKLFVGNIYQNKTFIIHPEFFDANNITPETIIHNLKRKPNMVHDLSRQMKISLKKQRLGNIVKHQIHKIIRITSNKKEQI